MRSIIYYGRLTCLAVLALLRFDAHAFLPKNSMAANISTVTPRIGKTTPTHDQLDMVLSTPPSGSARSSKRSRDRNSPSSLISARMQRTTKPELMNKLPKQLRVSQQQQSAISQGSTPTAPFPDGLCGGRLVTLASSETYALDTNLAGNFWLLPPRPINVWLPPGYGDGGERHPVIYVHDGLNAIEDSTSWTGHSWRLAGAITRLAEHNCLRTSLPLLVLMPAASETTQTHLGPVPRRHLEYGDLTLPFAKAHAHFVARTLKPAVDALFLTRQDAAYNFLLGSSLGGQASLNILLRYSAVFGGAACLSPAIGQSCTNDLKNSLRQPQKLANKRLYMDMGGDRAERSVPWMDVLDHVTSDHWWNPGYFWLDTQLQGSVQNAVNVMKRQSHTVQFSYKEFPGERHNERTWSKRIDQPILHLLGRKRQRR